MDRVGVTQMKYRTLGQTGLRISEISFGCGPNARLMVSGNLKDRQEIIARALDLGINYYDTAAAYGDGLSEVHLGEVLRSLKVKPIIGSKVAIQADEVGNIQQAIINSVEGSLRRLQVDCIDLIQLHNRVTSEHGLARSFVGIGPTLSTEEVLGANGVVETFEKLREQGKVRFFGFTTFGGEIVAIRQMIDSNRFHTINTSYNLLNPSAAVQNVLLEAPNYGQVIPRAAERNMGVLVIRVLASGALTGSELSHAVKHVLHPNQTLPQAATKFALGNLDVSSVVGGFSNMIHLEEAVSSIHMLPLTDTAIDRIRSLSPNNN